MWKLPRSSARYFLGRILLTSYGPPTDRARPADGLSLSWVFPLVAFGVTSLPVAENGGEEAGGEGGRRTEGGRGGGGDFPASKSHMDS